MMGSESLPDDQAEAVQWAEPRFLKWIDAALWIGARDPGASASLEAYRSELAETDVDEILGWVTLGFVADSFGGATAVDEGRRLLTRALQDGVVRASGSRSVDGEMEPIDSIEWTRPHSIHPYRGGDCLAGPESPWPVRFYNVVLAAGPIFSLWPRLTPDPAASKPPHPSSMELRDAPLLAEMRQLIASGKASSPHNAAIAVADQADGASLEAKVTRLGKRYRKTFGAQLSSKGCPTHLLRNPMIPPE